MRQVLFRLPIGQEGLPVYGFGAMLFLAFVACIWLATRRARKVGIAPEVIQDLALWIFGGGILGARVTYIILHDPPDGVWDFLRKLPRIWDGGIIFYGAVIGATISYFIGWAVSFRFKENVTTLRLADVIAPTIAVGLLLGRLGCFLNGCCYGQVACETCPGITFPMSAPARYDLTAAGLQTAAGFLLEETGSTRVRAVEPGSPLKVGDEIVKLNGQEVQSASDVSAILVRDWPRGKADLSLTVKRDGEELALTAYPRTLPLQPTQLYESLSMALVLLLLLAFDPVKRREGQVMALMMICYGVHRYFNEKLRIDQRPVGFESYVSVVLVVGGVIMLVWLALRPAAPGPVQPAASPAPSPA